MSERGPEETRGPAQTRTEAELFKHSLLETPGLLDNILENLRELLREPANKQLKAADAPSPEELASKKRNRIAMEFSALFHVAAITLLIVAPIILGKKEQRRETLVAEVIDLSRYKLVFPISARQAGGGGGGGTSSKKPASKGKLPRPSREQLAPPQVTPEVKIPKLPVEPTVAAPEVKFEIPKVAPPGDPAATPAPPSDGTGTGGGIGTGSGGGVGEGKGPGVGQGEGGGAGGGIYQVGGGVSAPMPIYKPEPRYSEEARKAKRTGIVVLRAIIGEDGGVRDVEVIKPVGLGLDEEAVKAVMTWRFKPAEKDGKPVPVYVMIEAKFQLY